MNKKKVLAMVTALCLVAVVGIGATLAYFTDNASVENVITMGHVDITLTENNVTKDDDGEYVPTGDTSDVTDQGLTFEDVVPGQTVPKNPTITVAEDSENCYVRALLFVESDDIAAEDLAKLTDALEAQITEAGRGWTKNAADGYFYYGEELKAGDDKALFETVTIPGEWNNAVADKSFSIKIKAEAVQSKYVDGVLETDGNGNVIGWALTAEDIQAYEVTE